MMAYHIGFQIFKFSEQLINYKVHGHNINLNEKAGLNITIYAIILTCKSRKKYRKKFLGKKNWKKNPLT
jgi:hypothetical protein